MTLTNHDIQAIKTALQPEFTKLSRKIDNFKKSNRTEHNMMIKMLDKADVDLDKRMTRLEENSRSTPSFKPLI